ncbi:MAG: YhcH/YjgK/YiaL family protein [Planctomycetes bacterium]|nr:YhcH/YjgK/YiaL family protein [Planctomycetota bacterium]
MIHDSLANAKRYTGLHPRFPAAFAWCQEPGNLAKPDGRYALQGDALFVIVETGPTIASQLKRFESHRRYIDIQINLKGPEIMEWMPRAALTLFEDFKPDNDICFFEQPVSIPTRLVVRPQEFAIFWPEDAHKPCCNPGEASVSYRKLVFKIAL